MDNRVDPEKLDEAVAFLRAIRDELNIRCPLAVLDIESSGKYPERDRILEIFILKMNELGDVTASWFVFNPGIKIHKENSDIHGLTQEVVERFGIKFEDVIDGLWAQLENSYIVGFNIGAYDVKIFQEEVRRSGRTYNLLDLPFIDSYRIWAFKERRTLSDAYQYYCGKTHDDAHGAPADVFATVEILLQQIRKYKIREEFPGLPELAEFCEGRREDFIDKEGKLCWYNGEAIFTFGKARGVLLREMDRGYLSWILRNEFPDDLKDIIREAFKGNYPVKSTA